MPWFPVDDRFHSHPKAAAASLAAIGLWTLAGSWANDHLQDGNIPQHVVQSLSRGATELADELVTVGLWRRTKAGYRFHQWHERNATRSEVTVARDKKSSGGVLGNHRRWHAATGEVDQKCAYCKPPTSKATPRKPDRSTDRSTESHTDRLANPPLPILSPGFTGGAVSTATNGRAHADSQPPTRCPEHLNDPDPPPCGRCADARRAHTRWETEQAAIVVNRDRNAPRCPERNHGYELAHSCRLCAAERNAGER